MVISGFRSGRRRRQPYPFDIKLGGMGLMLLDEGNGPVFTSKQVRPLGNISPTEFGYSSISPDIESTIVFDDFADGLGLSEQEGATPNRRYHYSLGNDHSIAKQSVKGPDITTINPSDVTTGSITKFFELDVGGTLKLFALAGRYILVRNGDGAANWDESKDLGSGKVAVDVETFYSNALSTNLAFVAVTNTSGVEQEYWYYDGTNDTGTWTEQSNHKAIAFKAVGREFYRAHDTNMLAKVDTNADPKTEGNWSNDNAFRVGDKSSKITRLEVNAEGALMIFKTDGVYTLDKAGKDHKLFPQLKFAANDDNGKSTGHYLNDVYVGYGEAYYRITPDNSLEEVGPERFITGNSGIKGKVTCFQGHGSFHAYAGLHDTDNDKSYLLKYGAWRGHERITAWHGSISTAFATKTMTTMFKSALGAASGHTRLYMGFDDGDIAWFALPCVADPSDCSEYKFTTTNTETYLPRFTGNFAADPKTLRALTLTGYNLSATNYAQIDYRSDSNDADAFISFGVNDVVTDFAATPRTREDFSGVVACTFLDIKLILIAGANTSSPQINAVALHYAVRTMQTFTHEFSILAEDGLFRQDNIPLRVGADRIRLLLKTAARSIAGTELITPDETTENVSILDYQESQYWDERLRQSRSVINVVATQSDTPTYGTYFSTEQYKYTDLENLTYAQIELL